MTILHKADFVVRELYYYDKFINSHSFAFADWQRQDLSRSLMFAQQRANDRNEAPQFIGYPMLYKCSTSTWDLEKAKCLYKHIVKWKIPRDKIIDI